MYITMQGNWTVSVKSKSAAFSQRFIIHGAASGNGTYVGDAGTSPIAVTGFLWTINIQNNPGSGFQNSDARIKFPSISAGNIVFDIESNDAGPDNDFNDFILTCSTPNTGNEYVMYGNASCYSGSCYFNPCYPGWLVIESAEALYEALKNSTLTHVIRQLYPERIPPVIVNPNPPDPAPFKPIMINLAATTQAAGRIVNVFDKPETEIVTKQIPDKHLAQSTRANTAATFKLKSSVPVAASAAAKSFTYDITALAQLKTPVRRFCLTDNLPFITLNFTDYDRTYAELHGQPYTGSGDRDALGTAITDMNRNYIFRFTLPLYEQIDDSYNDIAVGENQFTAYRPDIIVSVPDSNPASGTLYESAPYWNIPTLYHVNICIPCKKVQAPSICFNGNLIGGLGDVEIGGNQNTNGVINSAALDRNSYGNHLHADGTVSVQIVPNQAGFHAANACWFGLIDWKGCMYNLQRNSADPVISYYTVRFKKPGASWQFVNEAYTHPLFSKRNIIGYTGDPVGPFYRTLNVDGSATPNVPAYKNIQKEVYHDGVDWEFTDLDRFMQMNSSIYEASVPGTVYFMVEGYDASGNLVPDARDLIALFIDNSFINYSLDDVRFTPDGVHVIKSDCNLYRMDDAHLNSPLHITFKANDNMGFIDSYALSFSKCGSVFSINEFKDGLPAPGISSGINPTSADTSNYIPYFGTAEIGKFGDANSHTIEYTPNSANGKWLNDGEYYTMLFVNLNASKRQTNGYNSGLYSAPGLGTVVAVERIS